jgi:hypothetical protein
MFEVLLSKRDTSLHIKCLPHHVTELSQLQMRTRFHAHHHHSVTADIDVVNCIILD